MINGSWILPFPDSQGITTKDRLLLLCGWGIVESQTPTGEGIVIDIISFDLAIVKMKEFDV